jgi:spermidine/putrescine transport system permease protein
MSRERNPFLTAFAALVFVFLFAPIVVLIIFSFNDSRRSFVWHAFTTDWYAKLLANDDLLAAVGMTLQVGLVAVVVSTVLGSLLGLGLARLRFRGHGSTETLLLLPMVTPEIVMGLSLLLFFVALFDSRGSFAQLSIAHVTFCISFVAVVVRSRAAGMNPHLEEAARDLGASAWGSFRYVTLPLIAPGIVAGGLLALSLSIDDYVVSAFNAGIGTTTLPLYIYSAIKFGVSPEINAISTIVVTITALAIVVAWRLGTFRGEDPQVTDAGEPAAP